MKYNVSISGWVMVEVDAKDPEEAKELALHTKVGGEVYDYVIDEVTEVK